MGAIAGTTARRFTLCRLITRARANATALGSARSRRSRSSIPTRSPGGRHWAWMIEGVALTKLYIFQSGSTRHARHSRTWMQLVLKLILNNMGHEGLSFPPIKMNLTRRFELRTSNRFLLHFGTIKGRVATTPYQSCGKAVVQC